MSRFARVFFSDAHSILRSKVDLTKYIEEHQFTFDNVYEMDSTNEQVSLSHLKIYEECVQPLVYESFRGANTTCFAYG